MLPILQIVETDHRNDKVGEKSIYIYISVCDFDAFMIHLPIHIHTRQMKIILTVYITRNNC